MTAKLDFDAFISRVRQVASKVDPVLEVKPAGEDVCLVEYPSLGEHIWVEAAFEGEKFRVYKTLVHDPKPSHLEKLTPVGAGYLTEVFQNYVDSVGHK
jgi:hypothetical protein